MGDFAAQAESWGTVLDVRVLVHFFMPETYTLTILLRRARRLRELMGNHELKSLSEIQQEKSISGMKEAGSNLVGTYMWRPIRLMMDPDIFFINIYMGLAYANFYRKC